MYIYNIPNQLIFDLPYSDQSGEKIRINYRSDKLDITIKQGNDTLLVEKDADLDWLIERLNDIKTLRKEELVQRKEQNPERSVATGDPS